MFKSNLKQYRRNKNLTQKELAFKVGVTKDYISMIERGKRNPGIFLAKKLAHELDSTIEEIFFKNIKNKKFYKSERSKAVEQFNDFQ